MKSQEVVLVLLMTLIVSPICDAQHVTVVNPMGPYPTKDVNLERMEAATRMAESGAAELRREEQRMEMVSRQEAKEQKRSVALAYMAQFEEWALKINPSDPDAEITLQIWVNEFKKNYIREFIDDPNIKSTLDEALELTFAPKRKAILQFQESQKAQQQALQGGVGQTESANNAQ